MKMVEAIIKPPCREAVKEALAGLGVRMLDSSGVGGPVGSAVLMSLLEPAAMNGIASKKLLIPSSFATPNG